MTAAVDDTTTGWAAHRMDVDSYLDRLRLDAATRPVSDGEWLQILHRAHVATIPFENLDVVMGLGIDLDLDALQDKLVRRRRGGYCFEHNLLFAAVLERLGYPVLRLAGRVHPDKPGPRTHLLLCAWADDRWWLADVGFGGHLVDPLPLTPATVAQGGWTYRLTSTMGTWRLQVPGPHGWRSLYEFTMNPLEPVDCEVHNHYTATHPNSPFTGQIVAFHTTLDERHLLHGRVLTTQPRNGTERARRLSAAEAVTALHEIFGVQLSDSEVERLLPLLHAA